MAIGLASEAGPLLAKTESAAFYLFFSGRFFVGSGGGWILARVIVSARCVLVHASGRVNASASAAHGT